MKGVTNLCHEAFMGSVWFYVFVANRGQLVKKFYFSFREIFWGLDLDMDIEISSTASSKVGDALTLHFDDLSRLCP
jgi:hypothetical protein